MAKLKSLLTDTVALNDGQWIVVNEAMYDDLKIKTRGYTDAFINAQNARNRKARLERHLNPEEALPNEVAREINAKLVNDFLVLDVKGLENDDGTPVPIEEFKALLGRPDATRLVRAVFEAAGMVTSKTQENQAHDVGNLSALSPST